MSKAKVGEIQGSVNGDCPPLVNDTRILVKDSEFVMLVGDEGPPSHFLLQPCDPLHLPSRRTRPRAKWEEAHL